MCEKALGRVVSSDGKKGIMLVGPVGGNITPIFKTLSETKDLPSVVLKIPEGSIVNSVFPKYFSVLKKKLGHMHYILIKQHRSKITGKRLPKFKKRKWH